MNESAPAYKGHRYPPEIIGHAVWLYYRFSLSYRDVEDLLAQRGGVSSYESVRRWCMKFGPGNAAAVDPPGVIRPNLPRVESRFLLRRGGAAR